MARAGARKSTKRSASVREEEEKVQEVQQPAVIESAFAHDVGIEMQSDDEDDGDKVAELDDGVVDDFPEIDTKSDTEDEDEYTDVEGDEDEEDEDEDEDEEDMSEPDESEANSSSDSLHPFPMSKTVVSDITGQPKRVYPPIEPDYDSDSSTEDVCFIVHLSTDVF
jgi:ribosome biogenesis protein ERB1